MKRGRDTDDDAAFDTHNSLVETTLERVLHDHPDYLAEFLHKHVEHIPSLLKKLYPFYTVTTTTGSGQFIQYVITGLRTALYKRYPVDFIWIRKHFKYSFILRVGTFVHRTRPLCKTAPDVRYEIHASFGLGQSGGEPWEECYHVADIREVGPPNTQKYSWSTGRYWGRSETSPENDTRPSAMAKKTVAAMLVQLDAYYNKYKKQ